MKNRFFLVIATVFAAVIITSCAKVPQEALDAASAALEQAKTVQTDVYFPVEFAALNDSLTVMLQNIETEKSKSAKDFKAIKENADAIAAKAAELAGGVEAKKAEVKAEAETMMTGVTALVDEAKALILKAPKGKGGAAALAEIKEELGVIEASVAETQAQCAEEGTNYMAVVDKLKAATEGLNGLIAELKEAITKAGIKL